MLKLYKLLLTFILFIYPGGVLHAQKSIDERIKEVEKGLFPTLQIADSNYKPSTITERMKQLKIWGVSIGVINNYKLEWAKGYGIADAASQRPVTTSTLFLAGSISKSINAVGVLKLVDEKKISLEANINDYLKSWKFPQDTNMVTSKITTAHLLSHSAGLSVHGFPGYTPGDSIPTVPQILDGRRPANTRAVRSVFAPGLQFQYSGGGTTISQLIVSDVTSLPYDKFMQQAVLKPLGMSSSTYTQPYAKTQWPAMASAYYSDGKQVKGRFHVYPEMAAAGLWTNPTDLSKYIIDIQNTYAGKKGKVLSKTIVEKMLTPYVDSNVGLGVFFITKENKKFFNHGGADEGFRANYFGSFNDGYGAIVMVNSNNASIIDEILNSISTAYNWPKLSDEDRRVVINPAPDTLAKYIGTYYFDDGDSASVTLDNNQLLFTLNKNQPDKMYFTTNQSFFTFLYPYDLAFKVTDNEEVEVNLKADRVYTGKRRSK